MVICLGWPLPATSSSLPAAGPSSSRTRDRCGPHLAAYLALLRLGVAVPLAVTRSAVGSYPTISPLPHLREAVCFLLPCPSPLGAQALPGSLPGGARTFLEETCASPRPTRSSRACNISGFEQALPTCLLPQLRPSTAPRSLANPACACCTKVSSGSSAPRQVATTSLNSRVARSASPSRS